ncbi:lipolytic enzyme [Novosphingobium aromaticivorans DSM 12444]|uniref:Lipolytic enzyme n=1 Tax=Novosphingobium aromaticivorans (strain ATCC 700278 / DSM 12444 / CCUG 56034 / CIP 105152 / NBRC 16084 / F199) TaxID=279238 RepID=Q2G7H7_NOVAD|nr:alpha/beta hydrolase [Novosphingobium aromaticivorans]ABD26196.1 lipolytic enzyme [Novosphingobium aromaticivorans DSM 12444]SCY57492.1 acetyl esterase [Novosphingobium aromaticivorans]
MSDQTTHYVRPDVKAFLDFLNGTDAPPMSQLGLEAARASYIAMGQLAEEPPRDLAVIRDLTCPGPAGDIPLRLYDPRETREPGPAVVFFHGGGFVIGDLESHHSLCTEIAAELDMPVIAVDYRLAPEHPFPAAPDDCEAAARWIAANSATALGRKVTGLIPMGDSAGGNLTIVVTQALVDEPAAVPVIIQVPIYPLSDDKPDHKSFLDFADGFLLTADSMQWFANAYQAVTGHKRAYPIYGEHSTTPPTVLVTASLDPIRDSGRVYGAELIRAGAEVVFLEMKGTIHGFTQVRKAIPSAQADMQSIFAAIRLLLERLK